MMMRSSLILAFLATSQGFLQPNPSSCGVLPSTKSFTATARYSDRITWSQRRGPIWMSSSAAAISSNEELLPGIQAIDKANSALYEKFSELRDNPYFKLYSVDILASCEYMPQELVECYSETCEIYPVDEDEVSYSIWGVGVQFDESTY